VVIYNRLEGPRPSSRAERGISSACIREESGILASVSLEIPRSARDDGAALSTRSDTSDLILLLDIADLKVEVPDLEAEVADLEVEMPDILLKVHAIDPEVPELIARIQELDPKVREIEIDRTMFGA
jgi:hypothetical protein